MNSALNVAKSAYFMVGCGAVEGFQAGENQRVRSGDEDQTRVRFSYFTTFYSYKPLPVNIFQLNFEVNEPEFSVANLPDII
jgi:hypothetical protein